MGGVRLRSAGAALFLCLALVGCSGVTVAGVAGLLTAAGAVVKTTADVMVAVDEARGEIRAKDGILDKLAEFRRQYCARPELRQAAREDLVGMMVEAGIPEEDAAVRAAIAKSLGKRLCGGLEDSGDQVDGDQVDEPAPAGG